LNDQIIEIAEGINQNLEIYISYRNTWDRIKVGVDQFKIGFIRQNLPIDVQKDFGLVRFSLTSNAIQYTEQLLNEILNTGDDHHISVVSNLCEILLATDNHIKNDHFQGALALLWIFESFDLIIETTENQKDLDFQDMLIRCSAILRLGHKTLKNELSVLEDRRVHDKENSDNIILGLAYIYYHLWSNKNEPFTVNEKFPLEFPNSDNTLSLNYALESYRRFDHDRNISWTLQNEMSRLYAMNICIYYTTESGSNERFENIKELLNLFQHERTHKSKFWHSRYTDTIARYYHRKYIQGNRKQPEFLRLAVDYSREAYQSATIMKTELMDYFARLVDVSSTYPQET